MFGRQEILDDQLALLPGLLVSNLFDLMASSLGPFATGAGVLSDGRPAAVVRDLRPEQASHGLQLQ